MYSIGFIQGSLLPMVDNQIQSFPWRNWKNDVSDHNQPVKPVTYSVIKHGLIGLTKYLSTYWANNHVRVNTLCPGGVYNNHPNEFVSKINKLIPMNRMARLYEYKAAIIFLLSDASSYMTGQNLVLDGGTTV